jgi:hypothetical protein
LVMLERLEKLPGATPIMFPPLIFAEIASISLFCVSLPPPREISSWELYIGILGQADQSEMKMDGIGVPRTKRHYMAWPDLGPMLLVLVWASWPSSLTS